MERSLAWREGPGMPSGVEQDLRQIFVAMQHRLTQIDSKIDSLSYRVDRMTEHLDKHAERLDQWERRVSEVEDGQTELATGHARLNKELNSLQTKVDALEARSRIPSQLVVDFRLYFCSPRSASMLLLWQDLDNPSLHD
ncbi:hypothetical protein NDU88_002065 [Pleurodeles waltl]|uniref:Uncharacterized protein n=1 Tax=Pleurodeles waltl TaxID=8319 RepID=A0AAV7T255_PLEWA|nr:hypothetical protein NDU88_002065 [Pleurodeles waltl]